MTRRNYSADFKLQVVHEVLETGNNAVVARKHDINANMLARWVRQYKANHEVTASRGMDLCQYSRHSFFLTLSF